MFAVIVMAPSQGKWPVVEVYVDTDEGLHGWKRQRGVIQPSQEEFESLDQVLRHRNRWVNHAAQIEVESEDAAKNLLGKEYQGAES